VRVFDDVVWTFLSLACALVDGGSFKDGWQWAAARMRQARVTSWAQDLKGLQRWFRFLAWRFISKIII
jgi:hypothetical protein